MDHNKLWKILKERGISDHLTCLLRNLYAGQEATIRTGHGTTDWFQIGKALCQVDETWVLFWWAGPGSSNPIFCWWVGLYSLPAIYLGPNYVEGNKDNDNLLQKTPFIYYYTQCPQTYSRPPPTYASVGDSWTLTGKSGSVSYGVTPPFSWVLVHTEFCLCPPRVCFPVLCKIWQLCGVVNGDLLQEGLCHTQD